MKKKREGRRRGGLRKHGRSKRKEASRSKPLSRFVRGKISFERYAHLEGIKMVP